MTRRTYVPTLRRSGWAIEEHTETGDMRVIATDLGKFQAESMVHMIEAAIDRFAIDNKLIRHPPRGKPQTTLASRYRGS